MFKWIYEITDTLKAKLSEKGQGMVEYAIVLAVVAAIAAAVLWTGSADDQSLQETVASAYKNAKTQITTAQTNPKSDTGASAGGEEAPGQ